MLQGQVTCGTSAAVCQSPPSIPWPGERPGVSKPCQRWPWRCWDANSASASPVFVTSNPETLTAGQTPTGTVLQLDPADGEELTKSPRCKALLQGEEF